MPDVVWDLPLAVRGLECPTRNCSLSYLIFNASSSKAAIQWCPSASRRLFKDTQLLWLLLCGQANNWRLFQLLTMSCICNFPFPALVCYPSSGLGSNSEDPANALCSGSTDEEAIGGCFLNPLLPPELGIIWNSRPLGQSFSPVSFFFFISSVNCKHSFKEKDPMAGCIPVQHIRSVWMKLCPQRAHLPCTNIMRLCNAHQG